MGTFKVPPPSNPGGIKVSDLVGRLIAIWPLSENEYDTPHGRRPAFRVHIFEILHKAGVIVDLPDLGQTNFWQDVLLERMRFHDTKVDGWYVCRIIKPGRAYLPEPPEADEIPLVTKACDMLNTIFLPGAEQADPPPERDDPGSDLEEPF